MPPDRPPRRPPRLVDLRVGWMLQYAAETTLFDSAHYADIPGRLGQLDGYLQATAAAVVAVGRRPADREGRPDPWRDLGELIARVEAEFPGRLLLGPDDVARRKDDPRGLAWAVLGVDGFEALIREPGDLDRLPGLFARGVRAFRPVSGPGSGLGGAGGDDARGLTDLGREFLQALAALSPANGQAGPTPLLDLHGLGPDATAEALDAIEADGGRVVPIHTRAALGEGGLPAEVVGRVRALGGVLGLAIGPPEAGSADALRAAIEAAGPAGLGLATGFVDRAEVLPELKDAEAVVDWFASAFGPLEAAALVHGNARLVLERAAGVA